jgi:type III secretion protein C
MGNATNRTDLKFSAVKAAVVLCALALLAAPAGAAEPRWPSGTYKYITVDQTVSDALMEFGRNTGIPVRVSGMVKGRLAAELPVGTAREFLQNVCNRYGLVWYYDGGALDIAAESEVRTEMIRLDANTASTAMARLDELGITDARYPVKVSEKDDLVSVSGPPVYLDLVRKALGAAAAPSVQQAADGSNTASVRVFRGRTADTETVPDGKKQ